MAAPVAVVMSGVYCNAWTKDGHGRGILGTYDQEFISRATLDAAQSCETQVNLPVD